MFGAKLNLSILLFIGVCVFFVLMKAYHYTILFLNIRFDYDFNNYFFPHVKFIKNCEFSLYVNGFSMNKLLLLN